MPSSSRDKQEVAEEHYREYDPPVMPIVAGGAVAASLMATLFLGLWQTLIFAAWLLIGLIVITHENEEDPCSLTANPDKEETDLYNKFIDALVADRVIDTATKKRDYTLEVMNPGDPITFKFKTRQSGKTQKTIENAAQGSLLAFQANRVTVEKQEDSSFIIRYWDSSEADYLARTPVPFADLPKNGISIGRFPIGRFSDGSTVWMSNLAQNTLIAGNPRSGKSVLLNTIICNCCLIETELIFCCSSKIIDFKNLSPRCELLQDPLHIYALLKSLETVVENRKKWCMENDKKKIETFTKEMPHITVVLDEFTVLRNAVIHEEGKKPRKIGEEIVDLVHLLIAQGGFAGVNFIIALQRASASNLSSNLRDLVDNRISFACETTESEKMILGDRTVGCTLLTTKHKGVGYAAVNGEPPRIFKAAMATEKEEKEIPKKTARYKQEIVRSGQWSM